VGYFARRVLAALLLVFAVSSGALLLAQLAPGDFVATIGKRPEEIAAERHRLGLDRPVHEQYVTWLKHTLTLDLGQSYQFEQPVTTVLAQGAGNTARLAILALLVATALGIPAGVVSGSSAGWPSRLITAVSLAVLSVPPLIGSLVLLAFAARTGWLPVSGMGSAAHYVVPTLALALPVAAMLERLQSDSIAQALARPSSAAARARGIPESRVVWRHAWRQSLGPVLAIYGVVVGTLFSGSFAVEIVTSWPGLGRLMQQALMSRDTNLVAGCAAVGAAFLAIGILAADVAHVLSDPRADLESSR
jgi:peptide/nickel transport system permease protein